MERREREYDESITTPLQRNATSFLSISFFIFACLSFAYKGVMEEWERPETGVSLNKLLHSGILLYFSFLHHTRPRLRSLTSPFSLFSCLFLFAHEVMMFDPDKEWSQTKLAIFLWSGTELMSLQDGIPPHTIFALVPLLLEVHKAKDVYPYIFHCSFLLSLSCWKPSSTPLYTLVTLSLFTRHILLEGFTITTMLYILSTARGLFQLFFFHEAKTMRHTTTWIVEGEEPKERSAEEHRVVLTPTLLHIGATLLHTISLFLFSCRNEDSCLSFEDTSLVTIHSFSTSAFLLGMLPSFPFLKKYATFFPFLDVILSVNSLTKGVWDGSQILRLATASVLITTLNICPYQSKRVRRFATTSPLTRLILFPYCLLFYIVVRAGKVVLSDTEEEAVSLSFHYIVVLFPLSYLSLYFPNMTYTRRTSIVLFLGEVSSNLYLYITTSSHTPFLFFISSFPLLLGMEYIEWTQTSNQPHSHGLTMI